VAFALLGVVALLPQMAGAIHGAGSSALASFQLPSLQAGMSKEQIDQVVRDAIMEGLRAQALETSTHAASKSDDIEVCVCAPPELANSRDGNVTTEVVVI